MYKVNAAMLRHRGLGKIAATVVVVGCSTSLTAGAATSDEPDEEPTPSATMAIAFTDGPGEHRVHRVYACAEDCLVVNPETGYANIHSGKWVARTKKQNDAGQWVLSVPEGSYYVALEMTDPDRYSTIGYIKAEEATPRVTVQAEEALLSPVAGETDLGTFTLYSRRDMSVPGRLTHGTMHVLGDEYFFTEMAGRRLPSRTKVVSTYRTCAGKKKRFAATASKKGAVTYDVEARVSQIPKKFAWKTKLSHPKYATRVETFAAQFTKEYKNGC